VDLTLLYAEWISGPEASDYMDTEDVTVPEEGYRYLALFFKGTERESGYFDTYGYDILVDGEEISVPDDTYGMTVDGFDAGSTSYYLNTGMSIVKALYFIVPENAEQYSLIRENKPTARIDFTQEEIGTEPFEYAAGPDTMDITESTAFDVSKFKGHETKKVYFGTMIEPYVSENGNMKLYLYSDYKAEEPFSEIGVLAE
jgi:hypothetical protein